MRTRSEELREQEEAAEAEIAAEKAQKERETGEATSPVVPIEVPAEGGQSIRMFYHCA